MSIVWTGVMSLNVVKSNLIKKKLRKYADFGVSENVFLIIKSVMVFMIVKMGLMKKDVVFFYNF